ncbi:MULTISPECIES: NAD(P)/FAD-dependent oxidoreductase [unclassified Flavobacterium]|uniref:NAD(P)/FAD-dependent oxidoreductase n=1 Tax=unclassified Flavobacterium TaxID=196869 RepID=UPI001F146974|nr:MULTISPECIES: NAD(P)/FAD-dependent oxidoreductase [unclassified Flavobacterium]UMY65964.1 NAD(P)/FAD-dependent oxidoreductase [Flavobacterium sp. HJ-32-4]
MTQSYDIVIVGGGAAGFFTALNAAEAQPKLKIAILERGSDVLSKVRVSGGGRCNVTHACFDPRELVKHYPRGEKELRGPFHSFACGDTIEWFERHGVVLKTEEDGRMFPVTDSSQTIIDCFLSAASKYKIDVRTGHSVQSLFRNEKGWKIDTTKGSFSARFLVMASGSNPKMWEMLHELGHTIIPPVPSLFTFNIKDTRIKELPGISALATVTIPDTKLEAEGPLLITHWGLSGPAILKLSAWGARILEAKKYLFEIRVNWLHDQDKEDVLTAFASLRTESGKKQVMSRSPFGLVSRLWESLCSAAGIGKETRWGDLSAKQAAALASQLTESRFQVNGKSTFKEEFVTAGGVSLKEVDFRSMESRIVPQLYFAGEVLDIDAITGGFNFQNAWTGGWLAAKAITSATEAAHPL